MLFLFGLLAAVAGASVYLGGRFHAHLPEVSRWGWTLILVTASLGALFGMIGFAVTPRRTGRFLFCASSLLIGFLLYLVFASLLVQLAGLVFDIDPQTSGYLSLALTAVILVYGVVNASILRTTHLTIPIKGLQEEIRAVHVSDVHLGHFRGKRHLDKIIKRINQLSPDVVFNTGDLFDSRSGLGATRLNGLRQISAPHFFVEGNHDVHVGANVIKDLLRAEKVHVLENEVTHFGPLQIIGLNHMQADSNSFDVHVDGKQTIEQTLLQLPINKQAPTIVLHHVPSGVRYVQQAGADLYLAGHTHGGQIFPLTLVAKLMFGYNNGLYHFQGLPIYVSDGAGTMFTPMRIGTRSEITVINLVPGMGTQ